MSNSKPKIKNTGDLVTIIPHRWPMQLIQAISNQYVSLLERVLTTCALPQDAINLQVKAFPRGAPFEFWDYGFYDAVTVPPGQNMVLFDRVVAGDTLLLLALRSYAFDCAIVLLRHGASLHLTNSLQQKPLHVLFELQTLFLEHQKRGAIDATMQQNHHDDNDDNDNDHDKASSQARVLGIEEFVHKKRIWPDQHTACDQLLELVATQLLEFHHQTRQQVLDELKALYRHHAPERFCKIESQMEEYDRRELLLLDLVKRKYVPSSTTRSIQ